MSFGFASFMYMLPLAAVPIIIHLLQRQRYVEVKFAATDFLRRAVQRVRRRILLQDLLLLFLRTMAVLLIVFALARPNIDSNLLEANSSSRLEIILIDSSMSMQQYVGDNTAFDAALDKSSSILRSLDNTRDHAALILVSQRAQTISIGAPHRALAAITAIKNCDSANAAWADAVQMAVDAVGELAREDSDVQIHIVSDFQQNDWQLGSVAINSLGALNELGAAIIFDNVYAGQTSNMSIREATVSPAVVVNGSIANFSCQVVNHTERPLQRLLRLSLDGKIIVEKEIETLGRSVTSFTHSFSPNEVGNRQLSVSISSDGLHADDNLHLGFEVVGELSTILCSTNSNLNGADVTSNFFGYLNLGDQAPLRPIALGPHQLNQSELNNAQLLILSDLSSLPDTKARLIADYVASGGGLLVLVGPDSTTAALQPLMLKLGLDTFTINGIKKRDALLTINEPDHPALALFKDPQWQALLTEVPHREFQELVVSSGDTNTILSFSTGTNGKPAPALIDFQHQRGRVAVLAAVPYAQFNRMPEVPGGTMALVYDLLFSLAPKPLLPPAKIVGEQLDLPENSSITSPSGVSLPFTSRLQLSELGAYDIGGRTVGVHPRISESDLRVVDFSLLPSSGSNSAIDLKGEGSESESPLSETLAYVLLACIVAESMLTFFIDKRRSA